MGCQSQDNDTLLPIIGCGVCFTSNKPNIRLINLMQMKKKSTFLKTLLLLCALIEGRGTVWATDFVINTTNFTQTNSSSGYAGYNGTRTISDVDITSSNVMVQGSNLQFKKNVNACLYNSTAMPGNITKITLASTENLTIYVGTSANSETITVASGSTISGNYTFFKVKCGSSLGTTATITVEYSTGPSYTISVQSNNTTYGTVELSGNVITAPPATGYTYAIPAYSVDPEESATVVKDVNEFTVTPSANTTVTINFEALPSYTIIAQSNNTSYGTVSLTGNIITATPATGYTYASSAYSVSPANSATVAQDGNEFTVTPSANTTVTINFEAVPTHTVTLSDDIEHPLTETFWRCWCHAAFTQQHRQLYLCWLERNRRGY